MTQVFGFYSLYRYQCHRHSNLYTYLPLLVLELRQIIEQFEIKKA